MKLRDQRRLLHLNTDDAPDSEKFGIDDVTDALNVRLGSSKDQHEGGRGETLQGEIEVLINAIADITYYGSAIGGAFVYSAWDEVQIGSQVWMKKNYAESYPGSKVYDDDEDNASVYGRLYTHNQIMSADFCPLGWHVPTEAEVDELLTYLGGAAIAGAKLKEVGDSHWLDPNTGASDDVAFRALPGGKYDDAFELLQSAGLFWIADEGVPIAPEALNGSEISYNQFKANWKTVEGATGYCIDVATDVAFTAILGGYNNKDVGNVLVTTVNGLSGTTPYYYRVRAYNEIGSSGNSNVQSITTLFVADDWYLPSKDELHFMYLNLKLSGVGGFQSDTYASSSEWDKDNYWIESFDPADPGPWFNVKSGSDNIRACRSFVSSEVYSLRDAGPGEGLIFHIINNGDGTYTYYEADMTDRSIAWSNVTDQLVVTGTAVGTGRTNTTAIIGQVGHVNSAAKLCADLIIV